jgi:dTDP-4-amino-4,6-dideoxygalactose transaminase
MGDGGAVVTQDEALFERLRMIANHGARRKYYHEIVGVNSRLDTLQAAILRVKLAALDDCITRRQAAAARYNEWLSGVPGIITPYVDPKGTHVYHQYTIRVTAEFGRSRDALADHLKANGIPCMVYYPVALHQLPVFRHAAGTYLPHAERAATEVLSLPMHTELTAAEQEQIVSVLTA